MIARDPRTPRIQVGDTFSRLTVIQPYLRAEKQEQLHLCHCKCGKETEVPTGSLRNGNTRSCGCLQRDTVRAYRTKHGHGGGSPTYNCWKNMRSRCRNPNNHRWSYYGGRGISVCERWDDFANFLADMGEKPEGTTLDRINSDGNYEPNNCRWVTATVQSRNRRHVKMTMEKAREVRTAREHGTSNRELAALYGVTRRIIYDIVAGHTWREAA